MLKFEIYDHFKDESKFLDNMYQNKDIELKPGITILVGCNGSGKSTFLDQLEYYCEDNNITAIFKSLKGCESELKSKYGYRGNMVELATVMSSSEGEILSQGVGELFSYIGSKVSKLSSDDEKLVIGIDASDSGSSIDNLLELKEVLNLVIKDTATKTAETYIVVSTNAYELANGMECFSVNEGKYLTFKDYEEYKEYILKTAEWKSNRYDN